MYAIYIDTPCDGNGHQFQKDKLQHYSKFFYQLLKNRGSRGKTTKLRCFLCVCPIYRHSMKGKRSSGNQGQTMKLHLFLACTLEKNTRDEGQNYKTTPFCVYALYNDSPYKGKGRNVSKAKHLNYTFSCINP